MHYVVRHNPLTQTKASAFGTLPYRWPLAKLAARRQHGIDTMRYGIIVPCHIVPPHRYLGLDTTVSKAKAPTSEANAPAFAISCNYSDPTPVSSDSSANHPSTLILLFRPHGSWVLSVIPPVHFERDVLPDQAHLKKFLRARSFSQISAKDLLHLIKAYINQPNISGGIIPGKHSLTTERCLKCYSIFLSFCDVVRSRRCRTPQFNC